MIRIEIYKEKLFPNSRFTTIRIMNMRTFYIGRLIIYIKMPSLFYQVPNKYGGYDHKPTRYNNFFAWLRTVL